MACYEPKQAPTVLENFQPRHLHAKSSRHQLREPIARKRESYWRCGMFVGANPAPADDAIAGRGRIVYPLFAMDAQPAKKEAAEDICCTKKQLASGALTSGLIVRSRHPVQR